MVTPPDPERYLNRRRYTKLLDLPGSRQSCIYQLAKLPVDDLPNTQTFGNTLAGILSGHRFKLPGNGDSIGSRINGDNPPHFSNLNFPVIDPANGFLVRLRVASLGREHSVCLRRHERRYNGLRLQAYNIMT